MYFDQVELDKVAVEDEKQCPNCDGKGHWESHPCNEADCPYKTFQMSGICGRCQGTGKI